MYKNFIIEAFEEWKDYGSSNKYISIKKDITNRMDMWELLEKYDDAIAIDTEIVMMAIENGWDYHDYLDDRIYPEEEDWCQDYIDSRSYIVEAAYNYLYYDDDYC